MNSNTFQHQFCSRSFWLIALCCALWPGLEYSRPASAAPAKKPATKPAKKPAPKPGAKPIPKPAAKPVAAVPTLYGRQILVPEGAGKELLMVAEDAAQTLQKMTGEPFQFSAMSATTPTSPMTQAIVLMRSSAPDAPADAVLQLKGKGREPFVIRGDKNRLLIIANGDDGLRHGLYFYLDQLGCRWYLPNENWTIIPTRQDVALNINRLVAPAFRARGFFGTGGFGRPKANRFVDLEEKLPQQWERWQRRNLFGGEFRLGGHAGETFNLNNRKILEAHPEYLAEIDGKFAPWGLGTKPNVSNPDLVKLYVEDRLKKYRSQRLADPNGPTSYAVSVEPSDGSGHSNSGPSLQIGNGSPSDQVFSLANATARAVAAEFPDGYVNLLAYNQHAMPPSIAIEPNVYVSLAPYAFQRTGMSGDEMVEAWSHKVPHMGIYDYWSMPDWANDLPLFDFKRTPKAKLDFWRKNGVDSFSSESSYSGGAMGLAWYISSRLMWNPDADVPALLSEFYRDAFGPAEKPMKQMLERWADGFLLTDHELGLSFRDLAEARRLAANNPAVMARLDDYGLYLHYLRLRYEFVKTKPQSPERTASALKLLHYIWSIYDSAMVHTFRLTMLIVNRDDPKTQAAEIYNMLDKNAPGWQIAPLPTHAEIEAFVGEGASVYQPLDFEARKYAGAPAAAWSTPGAPLPLDKPLEISFVNLVSFEIQTPEAMRELRFGVNTIGAVRVILRDTQGRKLWDKKVATTTELGTPWDEISVPIAAAGRYRLELFSQKIPFRLRVPTGLYFTMGTFGNGKGPIPRLYFYVPRGLKTLAVYVGNGAAARFYDNSGQEQTPRGGAPGIVLFDVPPGQDGQAWSMSDAVSPVTQEITLLNAPQGFAFSPDSLLVPQDALKR